MFFPLKRFKLTKHQKPQLLCFWQRFLSISGIPIHIEYAWFFINHPEVVVTFLKMSTCPRCGTGNFKEGRSLSMHLSRFCSGPTLLCNTLTGLLPSKRSTEQMRSESSWTTFQQKIQMFDSLASDVSFPKRIPLHSMPSLVHLSSTQSQLEYSNVNYESPQSNAWTAIRRGWLRAVMLGVV